MAQQHPSFSGALSSHGPSTTISTEFSSPTFMSSDKHAEARKIDVATLTTDASINCLRKNDPFMYFSVFKPTGNHAMEAVNHVAELQRGNGPTPSVTVERKTRISVECDLLTALQEMFELDGEADNAAGHVVMLGDNDNDDVADVFEGLAGFEV